MADPATGPRFLRRVQLALGMSAMEMAHELGMSITEYTELALSRRSRLAADDEMWLEIVRFLNLRIGACTAMLSEVNTLIAGRK